MNSIIHDAVIIILVISLLFAGLYQARIRKDWLAPASFWALVCFTMIFIPLLIIPLSLVAVSAILWIMASAFCLYAGGALIICWTSRSNKVDCPQEISFPGLALLIVIGSLVGLAALFIQFKMVGYGPSEVLFTSRLFTIMQDLRPIHLQNKVPAYVSAMTGGVYFAAMLGGFYYVAREGSWRRYLALLPFVPAIATAYCVTTKLSFLFPLLFWLGSFLAAHAYFGRAITRKAIIRFAGAAGIVALLLVIFNIARWMSWAPRIDQPIFGGWEGFWKYTFTMVAGHIVAFSHWFPSYIEHMPDGYGWGRYTVAGIFNYLGYAARIPAENVVIFPGPGNNTSNVYTVFRPLLLDFGIFGSLLVFFFTGMAAEYSYRRIKAGCLRWIPVLAAFYWVAMWNYNNSIFNYNSIILAFIAFSAYFVFLPYFNNGIGRSK